MKENPLSAPANYDLVTLFAELKFGRPAEDQKYLDSLIQGMSFSNKKEEILFH